MKTRALSSQTCFLEKTDFFFRILFGQVKNGHGWVCPFSVFVGEIGNLFFLIFFIFFYDNKLIK